MSMSLPTNTIQSISELALWVNDVDAAAAFYADNLGFTVREIEPGKNAFLASGDFLLVLFNPDSPGTELAEQYLARKGGPVGGGVYHVAFRVDPEQLDRYGETVRAHGIEVKGPVSFGTGRRSYFFEDLDAHYIELTDR
jgi:catechol 2,3-dioxygenase-like lactoylglutathione lyase family enzyme